MNLLLAVLAVWVLGNALGGVVWLVLRRSAWPHAVMAGQPSGALPGAVSADVPSPRPMTADDVAARTASPV